MAALATGLSSNGPVRPWLAFTRSSRRVNPWMRSRRRWSLAKHTGHELSWGVPLLMLCFFYLLLVGLKANCARSMPGQCGKMKNVDFGMAGYGWVVWPQVIIHMPVAPWHRHLGLPRSPWSAMVKWSSSPWLSWCLVMWPWADFFTVRWATICKSINLLTETCQIPEKHCHKAESSSLALKIGFNIYFKQLFQRRSSLLATAGWGFSCGVATSSQRIASSWRPQLRDSPKK